MGDPSNIERAEALVTSRCAVTSSAVAGLVAALGPSLGVLNVAGTTHAFVIARRATIISAAVLLGLLAVDRRHPRLRFARLAFALPAVPVLFMHWFVDRERAAQGLPVELFARQLGTSMAFAVMTPPRAGPSLVVIVGFSAAHLVVYWSARHSNPRSIHGWQPWSNLLASACLAMLALYRAHRQRQEVRRLVQVERAAAFQRLMRTYLAVRDLVNTPLQTLRVSAALLAGRYAEASAVTRTMERAVARLDELNRILAARASAIEWPPGGESFDPVTLLRTSPRPGP